MVGVGHIYKTLHNLFSVRLYTDYYNLAKSTLKINHHDWKETRRGLWNNILFLEMGAGNLEILPGLHL